MELDEQELALIPFEVVNDIVEEYTVRFKVITKTTGKVSHQFFVNDQQYNRSKIQKSGRAYFQCVEPSCKATLYCRYSSFDAGMTDEEPTVER